tara:strand:+ start:140 stop:721 length:582 start_codon:yes stop_codon:yes gene_type:complete
MHLSDLFDDTSFDMELDKIKGKIVQLYNQVLEKAYKMENPTGTPEEMAMFLEENSLEFKSEEQSFDAESNELQEILEQMMEGEDSLEPVKDMEYTNPAIEKGSELKANKSKITLPKMSDLPVPKGLMSTPKDVTKKLRSKNIEQPVSSKLKKNKTIVRDVTFSPLVEQYSEQLRSLEERKVIGRMRMLDRLEA